MDALRQYLNDLSVDAQHEFAARCGTSLSYLRKVISLHKKTGDQRLGESIVIAVERETDGKVRCETLRPDVDWAFIRGTKPQRARARA